MFRLPEVLAQRCFAPLLLLGLSLSAWGQGGGSRAAYIERFSALAVRNMEAYGIPASIILAQGILESGSGTSRLAVEANNHFGIKCHAGWTGPTIYHDDDAPGECFRKYRSPECSFRDHAEFLRGGRRYAFLFDLAPTDYQGWARGLQRAGYATNPRYAEKLIRIIEEERLYLLDRGVDIRVAPPSQGMDPLADPERFEVDLYRRRPVYTRNRVQYVVVREGDTYQSLTREMEMLPWELARYNELERNAPLTPGQVLYIQPKRRRAEIHHSHHVAEAGETMRSIAQLYGIRLQALYRLNRMEPPAEVEAGQKLHLRRRKPLEE